MPTRKCAGLVAALVIAEGKPVQRKWLEDILWPQTAPPQRAQSLRNALALLRRAFGDDSPLEINRTTCRLLPEEFQTDYRADPGLDRSRLALEMHEPWFADFRKGLLRLADFDADAPAQGVEPVEDSFLRVLSWSAQEEPSRALSLMRAAPELTFSLPPVGLRTLCDRLLLQITPDHEAYGWLLCFAGSAITSTSDFARASEKLRLASEHAMIRQDARLLGEATLWDTANRIVTGHASTAARNAGRILDFVLSRGERDAAARLLHAQGLAYHHSGRYAEGEAAFQAALDCAYYQRERIEQGHLLSHIALFRATNGDRIHARRALAEALGIYRDWPNWRLHSTCILVRALLLLADGERENAVKELRALMDQTERNGCNDFAVYAHETTAACLIQAQQPYEARRHLRQGIRRRQRTQMALTSWDRERLQPVVRALETVSTIPLR